MSKQTTPKTPTNKAFRTPIVAVMGHVDHGKTSLLDAIRGSNVAAGEAGGITQNTRAHQIVTEHGHKITFIDTPGHEAFSAMRARGAEVTDFVMLVVAADDGVQPQTKESIKFAHDTNTPIILVINKVDVNGVKIEKIKKEIASYGVNIEEYGGDVLCFEVSATKKTGIKELVEGIELLAEIHELAPQTPEQGAVAQAYVLESTTDKRLGAVALCILKAGNLDSRLFAACATETFKVRSFLDQSQKPIDTVHESDPFWISGPHKPLSTGDVIYFVPTEKQAEALKAEVTEKLQTIEETKSEPMDINSLLLMKLAQKQAEDQGTEQKVLNILLRASSQGTLEAVIHELKKLGDDEKTINIISSLSGEVSENDIRTAKSAHGIIITFQAPASNQIQKLAKQEKVLLRNYNIIYEMIDEISSALDSLIEPPEVEVEVARARVKQVFTLSDGHIVAGCEVVKGTLLKGYPVYVERPKLSTKDEIAELGRGKILMLKVLKTEVKEVKKGQDCGILINPDVLEIQSGDEIVAYKLES